MHRTLRRLIPSMFHRRLAMLAVAAVVLMSLLGAQLTWLTTTQYESRREAAESVLRSHRYLTTVRGSIYDRKGRLLARDKPAYAVAVHYTVINETWAFDRARNAARAIHRYEWSEMGDQQRERAIFAEMPFFENQIEEMWATLRQEGDVSANDMDAARNDVIRKVTRVQDAHNLRRLRERQRKVVAGEADEVLTLADVAEPVRDAEDYYAMLHDVSSARQLRFDRLISDHAGDRNSVWGRVRIIDQPRREYPLDTMRVSVDRRTLPLLLKHDDDVELEVSGIGIHMIGAMRPAWAKDVETRPFRRSGPNADLGGYRPGDTAGYFGVEWSREQTLRGVRGRTITNLETQEVDRLDPVPGGDVYLTFDAALQARVQAVMSHDPRIGLLRRQPWHAKDMPEEDIGNPLCAAAVVLDVTTGDVLAAVTAPGYSRQDFDDMPSAFWRSPDARLLRPRFFRPFMAVYEPGSTAKPLVLVDAYTDEVTYADDPIDCNHEANQHKPRCWLYKATNGARGHGPLLGPNAVKFSCNIYFRELGERLGATRMVNWYERWGFGKRSGVGVAEEAGLLRTPNAGANPRQAASDARFMGIGQGPVTCTPLQAANAYAALARGGYQFSPALFRDSDDRQIDDLHLDSSGVRAALEGMMMSANESGGTTYSLYHVNDEGETMRERVFTVDGATIYGKSGTATTPPKRIKTEDGQNWEVAPVSVLGPISPYQARYDHAWTVCLVQPHGAARAAYVVVTVVEYGGSGGRVSGPIVNQILHAMQHEGYF